MTAAPLIVVLDPGDEAATTRAALDAHAPQRGAIAVHPTPGQRTRAALCHDILAALGIDPASQSELKLREKTAARAAVLAHLPARGVRQVAVLRTHLFTAEQWNLLMDVREHAGAAVIALYHAPKVTGHAAWMLERVEHVLAASLQEADPALRRFLAAAVPAVPPSGGIAAPDAAMPPVPASDVEHFRADAARALPPDQFALLDAQYRLGAHSACGWIAGHRHDTHGPGWGGPPAASASGGGEQLAVFLADLVADSSGPRASIARIRGAQAGFLLHGQMLRCAEPLADAIGPGLSTLPIDQQRCDLLRTRLIHPVHAAALTAVLITGSDLRRLRRLRVADLTLDATGFHLPHPRLEREWYPVPPSARAIFQAARAFLLYRCADPYQSLLAMGLGRDGALVYACARRCALSLPPLVGPEPLGGWHHRAELVPAARPGERGEDDLLFALGLPTRGEPPRSPVPIAPRDPPIVPWQRHLEAQQRREREEKAAQALRQAREPYLRPMFQAPA